MDPKDAFTLNVGLHRIDTKTGFTGVKVYILIPLLIVRENHPKFK